VIGDYTYYDDPDGLENFEINNVLYHFDFVGDKLIIGKFCQIATGVRFIMNGANHGQQGFTTYPFKIFGGQFKDLPLLSENKGDTIIGNDVWIGNNVTFMPGVEVGDGAIIASNSCVTRNIEPYTVVGGNPAQLIRKRFDENTIAKLLELQWWNWEIDKIAENGEHLLSANVNNLNNLG
jgi:virginiamycin A acetyltransferase